MKMVQDYSFEEIKVPLSIDCADGVRSSIFGTKGTMKLVFFYFVRLSCIPNPFDCYTIYRNVSWCVES